MQCTRSGGIDSISASPLRIGNTPCVCVQTVIVPSLSHATAHDGPIDPCVRYGFVKRACKVCVAGAAAAVLFATEISCAGSFSSVSWIVDCAGNGGPLCHFAASDSARIATIAHHSSAATTAR